MAGGTHTRARSDAPTLAWVQNADDDDWFENPDYKTSSLMATKVRYIDRHWGASEL